MRSWAPITAPASASSRSLSVMLAVAKSFQMRRDRHRGGADILIDCGTHPASAPQLPRLGELPRCGRDLALRKTVHAVEPAVEKLCEGRSTLHQVLVVLGASATIATVQVD